MLIKSIVVVSTVIMLYSFIRCRRCISLIPEDHYNKYWKNIASLILFFILSYVLYGYIVFTGIELPNERLAISLVLFHGSVFVLLVTILSYLAFSEIIDLQQETQNHAEHLEEEVKKRTKKLEEMSLTDCLTGLYNQRFFFKKLDEEATRSSRLKAPLYLLMIDVDKFKQYNDRFGHLAGDVALQAVGKAIHKNIRKNVDSGFRYGGDEFVVILPGTSKEQALEVAKRILKELNNGNISISAGLVSFDEHGVDARTLLKIADMAMYAAKAEGGNRIKLFRPKYGTLRHLRRPDSA